VYSENSSVNNIIKIRNLSLIITVTEMKKAISSVLLLCVMALCSTSVLAADACEVVLCMYGKATGNGGGSECHSAERAFFNIVKKNKHGFLPDHTADARQSFLVNVIRQTRRLSVRSSVNMAAFVVNTGETGTEHDGFQVFTASIFRGLRSEETGAVKMRQRTEIFSRVKERK
jgi:hypothetical protein